MQAGRAGKEQGRMEGGREGARGGWGRERGIEGREGGSDDSRQGGRERHWRKGWLREGVLMKGRNEAWTTRGKDGREEASGGGIERGRGSMGGGSKGGKKTSREVSRGGHRPVYSLFTNHYTTQP